MDKKVKSIKVKNVAVGFYTEKETEYISLTDIASYKNSEAPKDAIKNWLRDRNTIEFMGLWREINNPYFKWVEFDSFKKEDGFNHFVLSTKKLICN